MYDKQEDTVHVASGWVHDKQEEDTVYVASAHEPSKLPQTAMISLQRPVRPTRRDAGKP